MLCINNQKDFPANSDTILETERLILRPWRETDAPVLYRLASDPQIGPNAGWRPHESIGYSRIIIRMIYAPKDVFAIILKNDVTGSDGKKIAAGIPIGSIGLTPGPSEARNVSASAAELGYWIGSPYWHNGFAQEAAKEVIYYGFRNKNFDQIWCAYYKGNEPSKRVMKKIGFYWHHTIANSYNPMLQTAQTEYFNCMTRSDFETLYGRKV